jgi:hypothetical protein
MDELALHELEAVRKQGKGVLYPEAVVEYAVNPRTALHSHFEWDDNKAGQAFRIWQARKLITYYVTVIPNVEEETQVYVSLRSDRSGEDAGGGYRRLVDVLSDAEMREQLLADALADFNYWKLKYRRLQELVPVFEAEELVEAQVKVKKKKK